MNALQAECDDSRLDAVNLTRRTEQGRIRHLQAACGQGFVLRDEANDLVHVLRIEWTLQILEQRNEHRGQCGELPCGLEFMNQFLVRRRHLTSEMFVIFL
jgi:hypothetical protein